MNIKTPTITTPYGRIDSSQNRFASIRPTAVSNLDFDRNQRYSKSRPEIYVHDYCRCMGAYIPRVWWVNDTPKQSIVLNGTVEEITTEQLHNWMQKYGSYFGWNSCSLSDGQQMANSGMCVILTHPKSCSVIVAETDNLKAVGAGGIVIYPVQSGAIKSRHNSKWWSGFRELKCWFWDEEII